MSVQAPRSEQAEPTIDLKHLSPRALVRRLTCVPQIGPDRARAEDDLNDALKSAEAAVAADLEGLFGADPRVKDFLLGVIANAPYLRDLIRIDPAATLASLTHAPEARMEALLTRIRDMPLQSEAQVMTDLRRVKREAALLIALADLGGVWELLSVTQALTRLADASVSGAIRFLLAEAATQGKFLPHDAADPEQGSGLVILAMGKQGAGELNYSSDIDLIVFYDGEAAPVAEGIEVGTFFVRLIRRMVKILQDRTKDGYVFRTDLRLRPDPGATAVAISLAAAFHYYESVGQNWERAALIKSRPCAGDQKAGWRFLENIRPFVWRKYLDYAAIRDIHSIKRQIHAVKGHGNIAIAGHNLKLGRGGIREIEFFVQTQQLIAGGRELDLRGRETIPMLRALTELGWLEPKSRDELIEAYVFLRRIEHRIQMVADEQTHTLPEAPEGIDRIARLSGFADRESFSKALHQRLVTVSEHYVDLFDQEAALSSDGGNMVFTGDEDDPETVATLRQLGFARPEDAIRAVRTWHFGRYPVTIPTKSREILTELTPRLLATFGQTDAADQALTAFDSFLSRLPAGVQLFSLLSANPNLIDLIATIMGTAPRLAEIVARRPHVMDAVLEPTFFGSRPRVVDIGRRLASQMKEAVGYEDKLDRLRIVAKEQQFLIGVRILSGTLSARQAGEAYAGLAEAILRQLLPHVIGEFEARHGKMPGGRFTVLGMGKLGGREMTATSDLDLILLYDHNPEAQASDGAKPLAPTQYYARLTQRLVAALTAPTAEGKLFEVDFQLRPSGNSGPLATHIEAFDRYHEKEAWTWEHMALTRARVVAGSRTLGAEADAIILRTLTQARDGAAILADVADMRARVEEELGSKDPWNFKRVAGGQFDVEFIAQALQLVHASDDPHVLSHTTETALEQLVSAGKLDAQDGAALLAATRLYQELGLLIRLAIIGAFDPKEAPRGFLALVARAGEMPDVASLEAHLIETERAVRDIFERTIGKVERRKDDG
ncbi:Glutamate-ammonia-ligase adenylyltransferase [Hartmannibacter diazotrophicus]|uniref:Bifunctional glutamine synthetase adenylyltransferase/adenylyl-removing enzyme n=1 Tax=Hartmannibacter diazotrophicus TaxID=1482074 RepID=A0A2C9D478_9HYPH|nr:bifunctional [glutamine synthetase] adenylyltransferase/[glutamine synthetase]-adenylyl-L-tyrosine phosphorylase [Hartmannibacter diazotrophicus]SON54989.1 Glutamate-ammonia-ligase adenylyltransferase [Hartmannibacter diazotrophicus]